jgi:hypothetical protein
VSYPINSTMAYVPPGMPKTKNVRLPKDMQYDLVTQTISPGVIKEGDMLGAVGSLRFPYHDLTDINNFLDLAPHNYLCTSLILDSLVLTVNSYG